MTLPRAGIMEAMNAPLRRTILGSGAEWPEADGAGRSGPGKHKDPVLPEPGIPEYDVVIVGGGPAGLSAAALCAGKLLRTVVFEEECWGGILTRYCPDKRIDNYPGTPRGILAGELAALLVEGAREAGADLHLRTVEEIGTEGAVRAKDFEVTGRIVILACGSTSAEANIPGERELAAAGGVHYRIPDPSRFRGMRVVVIGGGDTAVSHVQRLLPSAARVTLVHRKTLLRAVPGLPPEVREAENVEVLSDTRVERILGSGAAEGVRVRMGADGPARNLPADAVILATGRIPNSVLMKRLGISLDGSGQVRTDESQRTSLPWILAAGDVTSSLKMIVTAVGQAAVAAHEAHAQLRIA